MRALRMFTSLALFALAVVMATKLHDPIGMVAAAAASAGAWPTRPPEDTER